MESVTDSIARFVSRTSLDDIPAEAVERAKLHILDTLGVLCAGSREEIAAIVRTYVDSLGCREESTVLALGLRTSAPYAAFANGILAHALDYDDYEWPSMAHPSAVVLPAVLALGEKIGASGRACVEAYLVGLEVIARVGTGINPGHYDRGWHSTGTLGVLGAAAAGAKLLRIDAERVKSALGIAASTASGLRANFGTMTKPFHAGHAARNGVESALLASLRFTADQTIFERDLGFCCLFGEGQGCDPGKIVDGLGSPLSILSPGIGIKPYPSCAATHSVLDGMFRLLADNPIDPEEVVRIECGIFYLYPKMLIHAEPRTGLEGKFSLEFCVALALLERDVSLAKFTDEKVNHPAVREVMKKVTKYVTDEVGTRGTTYPGAILSIRFRDGRSLQERVGARKGSPLNPMSRAEIWNKFLDNASPLLGKGRAEEVLEGVTALETLSGIDGVIRGFGSC
jgi:2-methylcitrate dehydratase PrpD